MAEASKASLVSKLTVYHHPKSQSSGSTAIICHSLPGVCENGIVLFTTQRDCGALIIT